MFSTVGPYRLETMFETASAPDVQATFCATLVDEWIVDGVRHAVLAPGSRSTPVALALDPADTRAFLDSDDGVAEVQAELRDGYENGITAVPTYVFNGAWAVPGAQDPETFAKVLHKMADKALEGAAAVDPGS